MNQDQERIYIFKEGMLDELREGSFYLPPGAKCDVVGFSDMGYGVVWHDQHPFLAGDLREVWSEITPGFNSKTGRWNDEGEAVSVPDSVLSLAAEFHLSPPDMVFVSQVEMRGEVGVPVLRTEGDSNLRTALWSISIPTVTWHPEEEGFRRIGYKFD